LATGFQQMTRGGDVFGGGIVWSVAVAMHDNSSVVPLNSETSDMFIMRFIEGVGEAQNTC
jgi:hypothetical protein